MLLDSYYSGYDFEFPGGLIAHDMHRIAAARTGLFVLGQFVFGGNDRQTVEHRIALPLLLGAPGVGNRLYCRFRDRRIGDALGFIEEVEDLLSNQDLLTDRTELATVSEAY